MEESRKKYIIIFVLIIVACSWYVFSFNKDLENENIEEEQIIEEYNDVEIEEVEDSIEDEKEEVNEPIKVDYEMVMDDEKFDYLWDYEVYTNIKSIQSFDTFYSDQILLLDEEDDTKVLTHKCFAEDYSGNKWYMEIPDDEYYPFEDVYVYGCIGMTEIDKTYYPLLDYNEIIANLDIINKTKYKEIAQSRLEKIIKKYDKIKFVEEEFIEDEFITISYKYNYGYINISFEKSGKVNKIRLLLNDLIENIDNLEIEYIIQCFSDKQFNVTNYINEAKNMTDNEYNMAYTKNNISCEIINVYNLLEGNDEKKDILFIFK